MRRCQVRQVGDCLPRMRSCFLPSAQRPVGLGQLVVAFRRVRVQLESMKESRFCLAVVLGLIEDCTQTQIRSEEHTSELQSHSDLVCRLLLEKKKKKETDKNIKKS